MSQQAPNFPLHVPMAWHQVWIRVLTQPSPVTFEAVLTDPTASNRRAYTWTALVAFVELILVALIQFPIFSQLSTNYPTSRGGAPLPFQQSALLPFYVCLILLAPLFAVLGLIINVALTQWVAKMLGGIGTYDQLTYVFAAYQSPVTLLSLVVGLTPVGICLSLPLAIYSFVLHLMAIKAVNQFSYWRAFFSIILIPLTLFAIVIVLGIFSAALSHR